MCNLKLAKMKNNKLNNELVKLINPGQKIVIGITMTGKLGQTKLQHQNENINMEPKGSSFCIRLLEVD